MRCEARTLDDIRALGGNDAADERRFATVAPVSETNLALYRTFVQPFVRAPGDTRRWPTDAQTASAAAAIRDVLRRQSVHGAARRRWPSRCATNRKPVQPDNPLLAAQAELSRTDRRALDGYGATARRHAAEQVFLAVYGSPARAGGCGIDPATDSPGAQAAKSPLHQRIGGRRGSPS